MNKDNQGHNSSTGKTHSNGMTMLKQDSNSKSIDCLTNQIPEQQSGNENNEQSFNEDIEAFLFTSKRNMSNIISRYL